jgi:hypothetical protein
VRDRASARNSADMELTEGHPRPEKVAAMPWTDLEWTLFK